MRRRTVLATVGSMLLAGCGSGGQGGSGGPGGGGSSPLGGRIGIDGGVGAPGEIGIDGDVDVGGLDNVDLGNGDIGIEGDIGVEGDIGINRERQLGEGTETESNPAAAEHVQEARRHLRQAIFTYRGFAGSDASLLDVDPTIPEFRAAEVRSHVRSARRELEAAEPDATEGQMVLVVALRRIADFLEYGAVAEQALNAAYAAFTYAAERLYAEQTTASKIARRRLVDHVRTARDSFKMVNGIDARNMVAVDGVSPSGFVDKNRQLSESIRSLRAFREGLDSLADAMDRLRDTAPDYSKQNFETVADELVRIDGRLGTATSSFSGVPGSTGMRNKALEARLVAQTLRQIVTDLERAIRAQRNGNNTLFREAERAIEQTIESNDIVSGLSFWTFYGF